MKLHAIVKRCGEHLYNLISTPEYLGLDKQDLQRGDFVLRFSVVTPIKKKRKFRWDKKYKGEELKAIDRLKAITQFHTSDWQIKNKYEVVQNKMKAMGF